MTFRSPRRLTGFQAADAISSIDVARQRQLIWCRPDGVTCVFVHDKIRQALLDRLTLSPRGRRFTCGPHTISKSIFPIKFPNSAYHFDSAGVSDKAFHYALIAAEQARIRYALETAEQQYQDRPARRERRRDFKFNTALPKGWATCSCCAASMRPRGGCSRKRPVWRAMNRPRRKFAESSRSCPSSAGDMERAVEDYEQALRSLKRSDSPVQPDFFHLDAVGSRCSSSSYLVASVVRASPRHNPPTDSERLAIRLFSGLAHGNWYCRGSLSTLWAHLRGLNLAERYKITPELGNAYSEHAPVMSLLGHVWPGGQVCGKVAENPPRIGGLCGDRGSRCIIMALCFMRLRGIPNVSTAAGSRSVFWSGWEIIGKLHIARYQIAASYYRLGDFPMAIEECQRNHRSGIDLGDEQASGIILDVWARRALGKTSGRTDIRTELSRERTDAQGQAQVLLCRRGL